MRLGMDCGAGYPSSFKSQRWRAALCIFPIYGLLAPFVTALLVWLFYVLTRRPDGFLNFERSFQFWLVVAFVGAAPVLLAAGIVHFLARFKPLAVIAGLVLATGVVGWVLMGLVLEPSKLMQSVMMGLCVLMPTFLVAHWACRGLAINALPPAPESAKAEP